MSDGHERESLAVQALEEVEDVAARRGVEVAGRLVGEDHRRVGDQRAGDGDALALTARQRVGSAIGQRREPDAVEAAMREQHYALVVIGVVTVACGFYYYLKVVRAMYWQPVPADAAPIVATPLTRFAAGFLAALILILGIFPKPILQLLP